MLKSILLPLDGSIYSKQAAQLAWSMAASSGARVTAQHTVDFENSWRLVCNSSPGFASPSDYAAAYAPVSQSLLTLGGRILSSYQLEASRCGIETDVLLDQGNPFEEIIGRSQDFDMVVIGHRKRILMDKPSQFLQLSLAEMLAHSCPKPLLVVQEPSITWKSMTILASMQHINENYINDCLKLAEMLGLAPTVVGLSSGSPEEAHGDFINDLRAANSNLSNVAIATLPMHATRLDEFDCWDTAGLGTAWLDWSKTLIVLPTRSISGRRVTVLENSPVHFIRYMPLPALLLYPEEASENVPFSDNLCLDEVVSNV